jgi:hypothetical protein
MDRIAIGCFEIRKPGYTFNVFIKAGVSDENE